VKLLVVTGRYRWPPRRGDQLRTTQLLALLDDAVDMTLLTPEGTGAPAASSRVIVETYRRSGRLGAGWGIAEAMATGAPLQNGLFRHSDLRRQVRRLAPEHDVVLLQLARLAGEVEAIARQPLIVDLIDSLALSVERRAFCESAWKRPILRLEARRLARIESELVARSRRVLVVSERDRAAIAARLGAEMGSRVVVVPLAVEPAAQPAAPASERIVAFTGNLGYYVNDDALRWFVREVWPGVRRRVPDARLLVAGDRPGRGLRRLLGEHSAVGVELEVAPADLDAKLRSAAVAVAPLRAGAGVPVKILEAWSVGVPVVASSWAAAGTSGESGVDFLVADRPEDWVAAVSGLLERPAAGVRFAEAGRRRLHGAYAPAAVRAAFLGALDAAVSSEPAQRRDV
jgi:glycosyltransferase involved in cell wall biosynthesis